MSEARIDPGPLEVLLLVPTLQGGGAERVMVTLANRLDPRLIRATLVVIDMRSAVHRAAVRAGVEVIELGSSRVRYALPRIVRLIWQRRPAAVLSTLGHLNLALAMVRWLLPRQTRMIGRETAVVSENLRGVRFPRVWAALYSGFYSALDLIVCQSLDMQRDLVESFGVPRQRTVLINNPVDAAAVRRAAGDARADGATRAGLHLVAAGRLVPQKGFDLLIDALALCRDLRPRLVLLGDGPDAAALRRHATALGLADVVEFRGFVADPYPAFATADIFVLSSRFEGFPNVVLEALAVGTPVVACPAPGGAREILDRIPECVVATDISSESLARAIRTWHQGARKRVPLEACARFDVQQIVGRYERLFIGVANERR